MSFGDIPGWLNVVIGLVGLYFLIQTYRKEIRAPKPAATKSSAMPRERWLTPRRQFGLWFVLVLLAAISASFTFWQNRQANGPKLVGGIVYALLGEVNLEGKMTPILSIFGGIGNVGAAQSAALNYRVSVKKDGNIYQGTLMVVPKSNTFYPLDPTKMGNQVISFRDDDALYNKTANAIQPGNIVYGVLMVSFPKIADYTALTGPIEIIITFNDVYSNTYTIDQGPNIVTDRKIPLMGLPGTHIEFPSESAPPPVARLPLPHDH